MSEVTNQDSAPEKHRMDKSEHQPCAGLLVTDADGNIHSCNETFLEMSGSTRAEILGKSFFD
ncbi:MAG: PAS domain-containing protein, partial [Desulfoprunum sp.]|nr:PAS domain-containing protein [Desulfoprunum sp.]